jgi:pyrroloquinoline quinone biosynthesis protein B
MHLRILGAAAGGRFPQWNCGCGNCVAVRQNEFNGKPRTQVQLALSGDGSTWFLAGASPDLPSQIEATPALHPRARRDSPIAGVVLASADLDHVLGLLLLREFQPLRVYAALSILHILREENSMFGMPNRVEPQAVWTPVNVGAPFPLLDAAGRSAGKDFLCCEVVYLSGRYPKYVKRTGMAPEEATAALFFTSAGKRVAYLPAVGALNEALLAKIAGADVLLFDGTFWSDDELLRIEPGGETARQMGHIPVEESLHLLKDVSVGRRIYVHINNTNPILNEAGPEYRAVRDAGWEVAEDNWHLEL